MQRWVATLSTELAPATVRNYAHVLGMVRNGAVLDERIAKSPMSRINLSREETTSALVPLSTDQVHAFAAAVAVWLRAAVLTQVGLGLRQGELLGLTVDREDFLRGSARIDRQLLSVRDSVPTWGPTKTQASTRVPPLPEAARDVLAAHLAARPAGEHGLVFTNSEGRPVRRSTYAKHILNATGRLGIEASSHDLWPDDDDRILAAIDRALGPSEDQMRTSRGLTTG